jgi:hypothetical protein
LAQSLNATPGAPPKHPNVMYHVMSRGNPRQDIYRDDADRLEVEACPFFLSVLHQN